MSSGRQNNIKQFHKEYIAQPSDMRSVAGAFAKEARLLTIYLQGWIVRAELVDAPATD